MAQVTVENNAKIERLLTSDPKMASKIRKIVRQVLIGAASGVRKDSNLKSTREAYRAVRSVVYKKVLGGNVNILSPRKRSGAVASIPPAGRPRSQLTEQELSYFGADMGFIVRFLNSGTDTRTVSTMNTRKIQRTDRPKGTRTYKGGIGNRGAISPRNWFGRVSQQEINKAAEQLDLLLDQLIAKEFNNQE